MAMLLLVRGAPHPIRQSLLSLMDSLQRLFCRPCPLQHWTPPPSLPCLLTPTSSLLQFTATRAAHHIPSSSSTSSSSASHSPSAQEEDGDFPANICADTWFRSDAEGLGFPASESSETPPWPEEQDDEWYKAQAEDEEWFRREEEFYETRISEQQERHPVRSESQPDYLALSETSLFSQCRMDTFRASGPGGQHRNKTDSGVRLTHLPTGVVAQAVDDRSQHKNRAVAMSRLRLLIAAKVRRPLKLQNYKPPPELLRLLPAEPGKKGGGVTIGVNHPDFAKGVQALLDLLAASKGYVFYAAAVLRVSPGTVSKILTSDKTVLQATNELLISKGQKPFK